MNITLQENARTMLDDKLNLDQFLRVEVVEGGCAGLTYKAEIARKMFEDEVIVAEEGRIKIVASKKNRPYLDGLVIDFSDDLINGGLQFTNAKTTSTCGCGQSFTLAGFPGKKDEGSCCSND